MKPTKPANQATMNVSGNRNVVLLIRPLVACLAIGLACCVAPAPDSTSAASRSSDTTLLVESVEPVPAGGRATILVEDIEDVKISRVQDGYTIDLNSQTSDSRKFQIATANPYENELASIPVSGSVPSPMWWWEYTPDNNGTITISDVHPTKKITAVRGQGTSNGAVVQIKQITTGSPTLTVLNGSSGTAITNLSYPATSVPAGDNTCKILEVAGSGHRIRMTFDTNEWDIGIAYIP